MKIKIFWKKGCPNCPQAKKIGKTIRKQIEVQYYDIDTVEGLSEACMLNVMNTPTIMIVDHDNNEIEAWRGVIPKLDHIREKISS